MTAQHASPTTALRSQLEGAGSWLRHLGRAMTGSIDRSGHRMMRAQPSEIRLIESYAYDLRVGHTHSVHAAAPASGELVLRLPYDGERYVSHRAADDAEQHRTPDRAPTAARIGHLAISNDERTDLGSRLSGLGQATPIAIEVPIQSAELADRDDLVADRYEAVIRHDFQPDPPEVPPVWTSVSAIEMTELDRNGLFLLFNVGVHVPEAGLHPSFRPRLAAMELLWPTVTTPRQLGHLWFLHEDWAHLDYQGGQTPLPFAYDPSSRSVRWSHRPVPQGPSGWQVGSSISEHRSFTLTLLLWVAHPAQLAGASLIEGRFDIRLEGHLLSGARARFYDAAGHPSPLPPIYESRIESTVTYDLAHELDRRLIRQSNALVFPGVLPDEARVKDVCDILTARGLDVVDTAPEPAEPGWMRHRILAWLTHGTELFPVRVIVSGYRQDATRQLQQGGAEGSAEANITTVAREVGELQVELHGVIRGSHQDLSRTFSRIHHSLRDHFEHFARTH